MNQQNINTWFLSIAAFLISLHIIFAGGIMVSFWPHVYTHEVEDFILRGRPNFPREYDLLLFRSWIITNILLGLSAYIFFCQQLNSKYLTKILMRINLCLLSSVCVLGLIIYHFSLHQSFVVLEAVLIVISVLMCIKLLRWPVIVDILIVCLIAGMIMLNPAVLNKQLAVYNVHVNPTHIIILMSVTGIYFSIIYFVFRQVLKQQCIAIAGIILMIKMYMFHWGVSPVIWVYQPAVILSHVWDIFFLISILIFERNRKKQFIWIALVIFLIGAIYTFFYWAKPLPSLPYFFPLKYRAFAAYILSFIVPLIYMAGLLKAYQLRYDKDQVKYPLFEQGICLYGLASFLYYVHYPFIYGYFSIGWPLILLVGLWLERFLNNVRDEFIRHWVVVNILIAAVFFLIMSPMWRLYWTFKW